MKGQSFQYEDFQLDYGPWKTLYIIEPAAVLLSTLAELLDCRFCFKIPWQILRTSAQWKDYEFDKHLTTSTCKISDKALVTAANSKTARPSIATDETDIKRTGRLGQARRPSQPSEARPDSSQSYCRYRHRCVPVSHCAVQYDTFKPAARWWAAVSTLLCSHITAYSPLTGDGTWHKRRRQVSLPVPLSLCVKIKDLNKTRKLYRTHITQDASSAFLVASSYVRLFFIGYFYDHH